MEEVDTVIRIRAEAAGERQSMELAAALGELELIYLGACEVSRDERAYLALSAYLDLVGQWLERDLPRAAVLPRTVNEFYLSTDNYLGAVVEVVLDGLRAVLVRGDQRRAIELVPVVVGLVQRTLKLRPVDDDGGMAIGLVHKTPMTLLLRLAQDVARAGASDVMMKLLAGAEETLLELAQDAQDGVRAEFGAMLSTAFEYGVNRGEPMVSARAIDAAARVLRRYASPEYGAPDVARYPINVIGRALLHLVHVKGSGVQGSSPSDTKYLGESFAPGQHLRPIAYVFSGGSPARDLERVLRAWAVAAGRQQSPFQVLIIQEIKYVVMFWASNARRAQLESGTDPSGLVVCSGVLKVLGRGRGFPGWFIGEDLLEVQTMIAIAGLVYELGEPSMLAIIDAATELASTSRLVARDVRLASQYSGVARLVVLSAIARQTGRLDTAGYLVGRSRGLLTMLGGGTGRLGEGERTELRRTIEADIAEAPSTPWFKLAAVLLDVKYALAVHVPRVLLELGLSVEDE